MDSLIACHECDLLQREIALPEGGTVCCRRCGATLYRSIPDGFDRTLAYMLTAAVVFVVAVVVLNASAGFQGSFTPLGDFALRSGFGKGLLSALPAGLPVTLPKVYLTGFDEVKRLAERSEFGSYLLGEWQGSAHAGAVQLGRPKHNPVQARMVLVFWGLLAAARAGPGLLEKTSSGRWPACAGIPTPGGCHPAC